MNDQLAISIINYRTADMTIAAAQTVVDTLPSENDRVIIVDNASNDGSVETIEAWIATLNDSRVQLVKSRTNSGFSGGHNQGMAAAPEASHYLILNSDALLRKGFFEPLLKAATENPKTGLIGPQLEWEDGVAQISCFRFASFASELMRGAQTGPVTRILQRYVHAIELPPEPDQIEWMSFACILLRGDMVRELGPMDEGYFLYFEDSEYGLRARRAGWECTYEPRARAVHFRGGSGPVKSSQKELKRLPSYFWRSRTRFFRQAYGPAGPAMANFAWIIGRGIARLRVFAGRPVPQTTRHEWRDIWTGFLNPLKPDKAPE